MIYILLLLLFTSCSQAPLSVFTEYISVETLPSYRIGTPDPRLYCPDFGEKLHISWQIPQGMAPEELVLHLYLHYGNGEEEICHYNLYGRKGVLVYPLLNTDYRDKEGIFAYKLELYQAGELLDCWIHQLWAEKIKLPN